MDAPPLVALLLLAACTGTGTCAAKPSPTAPGCAQLADDGPQGSTKLRADVVVSGLEVPWSLAFLANGDLLVSERPEVYFKGDPPSGLGRLRDVVSAPDGALRITTGNCDGRGSCPSTKDAIVRVVPG